jgi:hypothetical protein
MAQALAVLASSPADYERLGLSPTSIAPWEDGARTDDSPGTYEWWYFDAHLADGAKLVVAFMNKDIASPHKPQGAVTATYSVGGERHETTGVGYHDHNWGNVGLAKVVHDWYWARGQAGPYSVIAASITAAKEYGFEPIPIFMLARDNAVIGDDAARVTFERDGVYTDQETGKPVAAVTRYTYTNGEDRYVVSFTRTHDLADTPMIDSLKGVKRIAARLARFDGAYLRFAGDLQITRYRGGELAETHNDQAIWELMYFGHGRDQ